MGRSFRHTPVAGFTTAASEKMDKRLWHRRFRARTRQAIHFEDAFFPFVRDVSDPWGMEKDGKGWYSWEAFHRYHLERK